MQNYPILTALRLNEYWLQTVKALLTTHVGVSHNHHSFTYAELPLIVEAASKFEAAVPRGLHRDIRLDALFYALWRATRRDIPMQDAVDREVERARERMNHRTSHTEQEAH